MVNLTELGTFERDTFHPNCAIGISNVDAFNFLLNPLFFGYSTKNEKNERTLIKWRAKF